MYGWGLHTPCALGTFRSLCFRRSILPPAPCVHTRRLLTGPCMEYGRLHGLNCTVHLHEPVVDLPVVLAAERRTVIMHAQVVSLVVVVWVKTPQEPVVDLPVVLAAEEGELAAAAAKAFGSKLLVFLSNSKGVEGPDVSARGMCVSSSAAVAAGAWAQAAGVPAHQQGRGGGPKAPCPPVASSPCPQFAFRVTGWALGQRRRANLRRPPRVTPRAAWLACTSRLLPPELPPAPRSRPSRRLPW